MNDQSDNVYDCDDSDLGKTLQRLFLEGNDEVSVIHPTEGEIIVTRHDFEKHLANIRRVNEMSPADRVTERKRLKNIKKRKQIKFRTSLIDADVRKVDMDNGDFGVDIEGNKLDIDNMTFVAVKDYPKGTELKTGEVGSFIDINEKRAPIRIAQ